MACSLRVATIAAPKSAVAVTISVPGEATRRASAAAVCVTKSVVLALRTRMRIALSYQTSGRRCRGQLRRQRWWRHGCCLESASAVAPLAIRQRHHDSNTGIRGRAAAQEGRTCLGFGRGRLQPLPVRRGWSDGVSTQGGLASRDAPFLEGIDLIGVSTNMDDLQAAVDAYREIFDKRIGERFGAKLLAIWPFGPQGFFCNQPIKTLDDLKTLRVRSFTPSMSKLIEALGATPVSIPFPEVYPSLQRGVANCGVTSPTSANTGRWSEVTSHLLPLSVSGSIQAHLVNGAWWAKLNPQQQEAMTKELRLMEKELWALARTINEDATNCSIGKEPCAPKPHVKYTMTLADVAPADLERVRKISQELVLTEWATRCERAYPNCKQAWNGTIGKVRNLTIP